MIMKQSITKFEDREDEEESGFFYSEQNESM